MRRDSRIGLASQFQDAMPKIQNGLRSINAVRLRLETVARAAPEELHNKQIVNLIESVRTNMQETLALLNKLESAAGTNQKHVTVIKKLRNDLAKEEAAIDAVVKLTNMKSSLNTNVASVNSAQSHNKSSKPSPSMARGSSRQQEREREKQAMVRENSRRNSPARSSKPSTEEGKESAFMFCLNYVGNKCCGIRFLWRHSCSNAQNKPSSVRWSKSAT